jgi:hypothetical protein
MAYRLALDENVEHEVFHRLENYCEARGLTVERP